MLPVSILYGLSPKDTIENIEIGLNSTTPRFPAVTVDAVMLIDSTDFTPLSP
jgi:hypothetical protein